MSRSTGEILLVEAECKVVATGKTRWLYACTGDGGFTTTAADHPPAGRHYAPRVQRWPTIGQSLFDGGRVTGRGRLQVADVPVVMRGWDGFDPTEHAFGGWRIRLLNGPSTGPFDAFVTVLDGVQDEPDWSATVLRLRVGDGGLRLDKPLASVTLSGTGGLDGPAELAGRRPPVTEGHCRMVEGLYLGIVDGVATYQVADRDVHAVTAGYVGAHRDLVAVTGTPTSAGEYRAIPGGYVQVGGNLQGQVVTFDVQMDAAADSHTAAVMGRLARRVLDEAAMDQDTLDALAAGDAALHGTPAVIGHHWPDGGATVRDALDAVSADIWAPWVIGTDGRFGASLFDPVPAAEPDAIAAQALGQVARGGVEASGAGARWLGPSAVRVGWGRCHRVHSSSEVVALADAGDAAFAKEAFRWVEVPDAAYATLHPLAEALEIETGLRDAGPATTLAGRMATGGARPWRYTALRGVWCPLGGTLHLTASAPGFRSGRGCRVTGRSLDRRGRTVYDLFG